MKYSRLIIFLLSLIILLASCSGDGKSDKCKQVNDIINNNIKIGDGADKVIELFGRQKWPYVKDPYQNAIQTNFPVEVSHGITMHSVAVQIFIDSSNKVKNISVRDAYK